MRKVEKLVFVVAILLIVCVRFVLFYLKTMALYLPDLIIIMQFKKQFFVKNFI
uniref:Candidate secreted effector n=1 Tax=Meloidogyne incognita TaxID=6306 RepID=A0A914MP47_MELIC